jgi:hypothetical protein
VSRLSEAYLKLFKTSKKMISLKALSLADFSGSTFFYFVENYFVANKKLLNLPFSKLILNNQL